MRFLINIFIFCALIACDSPHKSKHQPTVVDGQIDITGWNFSKDGPIQLDGDWLFSWNDLVDPSSWEKLRIQMSQRAKVPIWFSDLDKELLDSQDMPGVGYASFALRIQGLPNQALALEITEAYSTSRVFILDDEGQFLSLPSQFGKVAKTPEQELPKLWVSHIHKIQDPVQVQPGNLANEYDNPEAIVLVHMSNLNLPAGGFAQSIRLGDFAEASYRVHNKKLFESFMIGVFLIVGVYHLILFTLRRQDKTALYFGLFCLVLAIRVFSMGVAQQAGIDETSLTWVMLRKLEFISMPMLVISCLFFIANLIPGVPLALISKAFLILAIPLVLLGLLGDPMSFSSYLTFFQSHILVAIISSFVAIVFFIYQGNKVPVLFVLAFFVLSLGAANDIAHVAGYVNTTHIAPYTTIVFIMLQAGLISMKNAEAYRTAEHLTQNLQKEVAIQAAKYSRIQELSKDIQSSVNLNEYWNALKMTLRFQFNVKNFAFLIANKDNTKLDFFDISTANQIKDRAELNSFHIDITDPTSLHRKIFLRRKSLIVKKISSGDYEKNETFIIEKLKMSAIYLLPLLIADRAFGMFSIYDSHSDDFARVANFNKNEKEEIEQLSSLIAAGFFQLLQKERVIEVQKELRKQTTKLNRLQFLSQQIQNTSNLDAMLHNLKQILASEFNIREVTLYVKNNDENAIEVYSTEAPVGMPLTDLNEFINNHLELNDPKCIHAVVLKRGKSLFMPRLLDVENSPAEIKNRELLGLRSLFLIPLLMDKESFALLSFTDTKFQKENPVKQLSKEQRQELELLSQYVSSALYQALQKDQIEKAQEAVSRAKNESAINQLAAHLAHEVNNPLNYIATGKTMKSDSFDQYHDMIFDALISEDKDSLEFKKELEKLQDKFKRGLLQTDRGLDRITKVIAEIRAITGVDGLTFSNFDIVPIINEEMVYSLHRNQIKIQEQSVKVTGTEVPIEVLSNQHILARSIRTVVSNCIYFAKQHRGDEGQLLIDCHQSDDLLLIDIGNNSYSIKNRDFDELFDLEKSQAYGTEQIGLAMIKELLLKIKCDLVLADHGRESGKVVFQLQVPLQI